MKLNIVFNRHEEGGYATFTVSPRRGAGQPVTRNHLLSGLEIREWSPGPNGGLNHYLPKDKPKGSVWLHTFTLDPHPSYDEAKADFLLHLNKALTEITD
jgi:hypothetical protein